MSILLYSSFLILNFVLPSFFLDILTEFVLPNMSMIGPLDGPRQNDLASRVLPTFTVFNTRNFKTFWRQVSKNHDF